VSEWDDSAPESPLSATLVTKSDVGVVFNVRKFIPVFVKVGQLVQTLKWGGGGHTVHTFTLFFQAQKLNNIE
jgi:hypothetical protein